MLTSPTQLQNRSFHVVQRTKTSAKCPNMKNNYVLFFHCLWRSCCRCRRGGWSSLILIIFGVADRTRITAKWTEIKKCLFKDGKQSCSIPSTPHCCFCIPSISCRTKSWKGFGRMFSHRQVIVNCCRSLNVPTRQAPTWTWPPNSLNLETAKTII